MELTIIIIIMVNIIFSISGAESELAYLFRSSWENYKNYLQDTLGATPQLRTESKSRESRIDLAYV